MAAPGSVRGRHAPVPRRQWRGVPVGTAALPQGNRRDDRADRHGRRHRRLLPDCRPRRDRAAPATTSSACGCSPVSACWPGSAYTGEAALAHYLGLGRGYRRAGLSVGLRLSIGEASACGPSHGKPWTRCGWSPSAPALAASKDTCWPSPTVSASADGGLAAQQPASAGPGLLWRPGNLGHRAVPDRLLLAQNRWLQANGGGQPLLTTLTALVLRGTRYTLAHVGDCRAYLWRDGELLRQTSDHVWEQPHMQHVLTRALGLTSIWWSTIWKAIWSPAASGYWSATASGRRWATAASAASCATPKSRSAAPRLWSAPPTRQAARTTPAPRWCAWKPCPQAASATPSRNWATGHCRHR